MSDIEDRMKASMGYCDAIEKNCTKCIHSGLLPGPTMEPPVSMHCIFNPYRPFPTTGAHTCDKIALKDIT